MFIGQADGPAAVGSAPPAIEGEQPEAARIGCGKIVGAGRYPRGQLPVEFSPGI